MITKGLNERRGVPDGWVLSERQGRETWAPPEAPKIPLLSSMKIRNRRDQKADDARRFVWRKKAPDEKGYTWSMGYNHLSGRYTQGNAFPEMSGSSLNRKKNAKDVPATAIDILAMADKTEVQYRRRSVWVLDDFEPGRKVSVGDVLARIYIAVDAEDLKGAGELALRFSLSLRACSPGVSYGIHVLSPRSRGKIKDKATAFFRATAGDRIFGTFTFIAPVDDKTGQSILNKFLTQLRKKFQKLQYFWVAERQEGDRNDKRGVKKEATGNIHFHMILNKRLPVGRWNALWVLQQYNAGLVAKDEWGRELSKEYVTEQYILDQREEFKNKRVQKLLNPLDLKKVSSIGKLSSYLTKYITKQQKGKPFGCAVWHCSRRVSRMFTRQTVGPSAFAYMKSFENYGVDRKTGEVWGEPKDYSPCPFATVVFALNKAAPLRYLKRMEQVNKWILEGFEISELPSLDDGQYMKHYICKN